MRRPEDRPGRTLGDDILGDGVRDDPRAFAVRLNQGCPLGRMVGYCGQPSHQEMYRGRDLAVAAKGQTCLARAAKPEAWHLVD